MKIFLRILQRVILLCSFLLLFIISQGAFFDKQNLNSGSNIEKVSSNVFKAGKLTVQIPNSTSPLVITGDSFYFSSTFTVPQTRPAAPSSGTSRGNNSWVFRQRQERTGNLAEKEGYYIEDNFTTMGMEITREVWIASEGDAVATRQKITNRNNQPIKLDALIPLQANGVRSFLISDKGAPDWEILAQKRQSFEVPVSFQLGADKPKDAVDVPDAALNMPTADAMDADPFFVFHIKNSEKIPSVLIGFLSWENNSAKLSLKAEGNQFSSLTTECEFDGVTIPIGGERTSQWVIIQQGNPASSLISDYTDRVGQYHFIKVPAKNAPTVACGWYYYFGNETEKELNAGLEYLKKSPIPFDVYLIEGGWWQAFGDWEANQRWPGGMKAAADSIRKAGLIPGIWSAPFTVEIFSKLAVEHSDWLLRLEDGSPYIFPMGRPLFVLDPTHPGVCDYFEKTYRRIVHDWGYPYIKLDFIRSITMDAAKKVRFYDPTATRIEAYRRGLVAIRRGAGPDAYISSCMGSYWSSMGLTDAQRSGSDMVQPWKDQLFRFKQNVQRTWMGRLWQHNPDGMMVRVNDNSKQLSFLERENRGGTKRSQKEIITDDEAITGAVNQYIAGGMVKITVVFEDLDDFTKGLYRHIIPSINSSAIPLDPFNPDIPSQLLTRVNPICKNLDQWVTVTLVNWTDKPQKQIVILSDEVTKSMKTNRFIISEFFSKKVIGLFEKGGKVDIGEIPAHASRILHIAPWDGSKPVLTGTDLHFSGGGVEIAEWKEDDNIVSGKLLTKWTYPVEISIAWPKVNSYTTGKVTVKPPQNDFSIIKQ